MKEVKEKALGVDIKDELEAVDMEKYTEEAVDQAWTVIKNNIAWLVTAGCENITPVPYITDAKFYRPSSLLDKSGRDYKPKLSTFVNVFTDDPIELRFWNVLASLMDCATVDTKQYTRSEVIQSDPTSPGFTYEHWNDCRNNISKVVQVKATGASQVVIRHPEIEKVRLNKEIQGLDDKNLSRIYILQEIVAVQSLEVKVTVTNQETGEQTTKECTLKAGDPDMPPEGVPVAFYCDKFKVNKDGGLDKQIENNPYNCRNGIFEKRQRHPLDPPCFFPQS